MSKNQSIPSIDINSFLNGTDEERDKIELYKEEDTLEKIIEKLLKSD